MTRIVVIGLVAAGTLALARGAEAGIEQRQLRQQARISQGLASGALTFREAARLERSEASIERRERLMRRTCGGLSCSERAYLNGRLNRLSARIYRQKHDGQRRW
jgi:hypothetical protein